MPEAVAAALFASACIVLAPFVLVFLHRLLIPKGLLMATITEAATAIDAAATALNTAATSLTSAATAIGALNDTSALTMPLQNLASAVTAVQSAATAVTNAVTPPAPQA